MDLLLLLLLKQKIIDIRAYLVCSWVSSTYCRWTVSKISSTTLCWDKSMRTYWLLLQSQFRENTWSSMLFISSLIKSLEDCIRLDLWLTLFTLGCRNSFTWFHWILSSSLRLREMILLLRLSSLNLTLCCYPNREAII